MTTILVVDDEPAMVGMVGALLGEDGHQIVTAYDGETALRRHAEEHPDLVILDRRLPRMSGDEVCRAIRAGSDTPILMLTGEKGSEERLLAALASRPGEVVDRKALLRAGWPDERDPDPEWLKAHLARLRSKLVASGVPDLANVRGVGYRLG